MEDQKLSQGSHLEITAAAAAESSLLPGIHEIRPPGGIPLASCRQHARCNEGHLIYTPFGAEKGGSYFACFNINRIVEYIHVLRSRPECGCSRRETAILHFVIVACT